MRIGASTGCFYPELTEKSLTNLGELGVKTAEVFTNSFGEISPAFVKQLNDIKNSYGMEIISFHPFMSFAEGFFLFSEHERRYEESLDMYKPFFEAAANLGAKYYVLHGAKKGCPISREMYIHRYSKFCETAKQYGVQVAHENVVYYESESVEFMKSLQAALGDDFKMVLDLKQARRADVDPFDFISAVGENIAHVHVSDCTAESLCAPINENGLFDFTRLFNELEQKGYDGKFIVELYSQSYTDKIQIAQSIAHLDVILNGLK